MGRTEIFYEILFQLLLRKNVPEHLPAELLRPALRVPGSDPAGDPAEPAEPETLQGLRPDGHLCAPLHFHGGAGRDDRGADAFAEQYAEVLGKVSKHGILISDTDQIIAAAGIPKKEVLERRISSALEDYMDARRPYAYEKDSDQMLYPIEGTDKKASLMYPIISAGDLAGSVIMLSDEKQSEPTDSEVKLLQAASAFLGKQLNE